MRSHEVEIAAFAPTSPAQLEAGVARFAGLRERDLRRTPDGAFTPEAPGRLAARLKKIRPPKGFDAGNARDPARLRRLRSPN